MPDKYAFITGAVSGLGLEFAKNLAKQGWTLGVTDIQESKLRDIKEKLLSIGAKDVCTFCFDVGDRITYATKAKEFLDWAPHVNLLINNAGVGDGGDFLEYKLEDWEWLMQVNFMGVVYGCKFFVETFKNQNNGLIINISSAAGFANGPGMSPYNASKAAVRSLSETLRYELAPFNINICTVMPTFFKTNVMQFARGPESAKGFARKMIDRSDLEAEEVAQEILTKAFANQEEIILPKSARKLYQLKRFFPGVFRRKAIKMVKQNLAKKSTSNYH